MKIWGTGVFMGFLAAAGCTAPAAPAAYEGPSDAKAMVDRLRVERPSYRPLQNGVEPLSVFIEAPPTYYPAFGCDYRTVRWADCGYRPYARRFGSCAPRPYCPPRRW